MTHTVHLSVSVCVMDTSVTHTMNTSGLYYL